MVLHRNSSFVGRRYVWRPDQTPASPSGRRRLFWEKSVNGWCLGVFLSAAVASCAPATMQVGAGHEFRLPSRAIAEAGSGDTVLIQPGVYTDCARIRASHVTIAGAGPGVVLTGKTCNGKAILVIDGNDVTIRNLTLQNATVADQNGAGIRAEGGSLTVDNVRFLDSQMGILIASKPRMTVRVINSDFERNGACGPAHHEWCGHAVYAGHIAELDVSNSRFFDQYLGHHIKSRALKTVVQSNTIMDGPDGTASYEVDIPQGGTLIMQNNTLQKGPKADNWTAAVILGEEAKKFGAQPTHEILVEGNSFTNDNQHRTIFVHNETPALAQLQANQLRGNVEALSGPGTVH